MNCKQGDLAVIIIDIPSGADIGKIVEVVEPAPRHGEWLCRSIGGPLTWQMINDRQRLEEGDIPDSWLRPIRGENGEDQTLTWAGKPEEVTA